MWKILFFEWREYWGFWSLSLSLSLLVLCSHIIRFISLTIRIVFFHSLYPSHYTYCVLTFTISLSLYIYLCSFTLSISLTIIRIVFSHSLYLSRYICVFVFFHSLYLSHYTYNVLLLFHTNPVKYFLDILSYIILSMKYNTERK